MNCREVRSRLLQYSDRKLENSVSFEVREHIEGCGECARLFNENKEVFQYLSGMKGLKMPPGLEEKLNRRLENTVPSFGSFSFNYFARGAAVACLLIWLALFVNYISRRDKGTDIIPVQVSTAKTGGEETAEPQKAILKTETKQARKEAAQETPAKKKETVEIVKLNPGANVFRGAEVITRERKIIKQWQDTASGIKDRESIIIKTRAEWEKLWKRHTRAIAPAPALPEVDFSRNIVIAVFMGEKNTGGYGIQISGIKESNNNLYIELEETVPSSGAVAIQQLTQPYHIVVVGKE